MKTILFTRVAQSLAAIALVTTGASAIAAATWNGSSFSCGNDTNFGNTWSVKTGADCTNGATVVTASAWSSSVNSVNTQFTDAQLKIYGGGFGVSNRDEGLSAPSDSHTIDNSSAVDLVALDFGSAKVKLSSAMVGYIGGNAGQNDSDISVFAWTGVGAPPAANLAAAISGKTLSGLVAVNSGWTLVGSYADLAVNAPRTVNDGSNTGNVPLSSSWWLLSAYSTSYGGTWSNTNDYFKLNAITGTTSTNNVPEPGSLVLLGAGLLGLMASRRRTQKIA